MRWWTSSSNTSRQESRDSPKFDKVKVESLRFNKDGKVATVHLEKVNKMQQWSLLVASDPEVNIKMINPENPQAIELGQ